MNDEELVEVMAEFMADSTSQPEAEAGLLLDHLRSAGFQVFKPEDAERKWRCQGRVWPAGKPIDPTQHKADEGHAGCRWVYVVPADSGGSG